MQDVPSLSPLLQYGWLPIFLALSGIVLVCIWYGFVFWLTRRKPQKVLATLPPAPQPIIDRVAIKQAYLGRIDEIETAYRTHEMLARTVHQQLSVLLRRFVAEVNHVPAQTMTLADLKKTSLSTLVPVIESYYQPEFSAALHGSVDTALAAARKVVNEWS